MTAEPPIVLSTFGSLARSGFQMGSRGWTLKALAIFLVLRTEQGEKRASYPDPAPPRVRGRGEARGSLSRFGNLAKGAIGAVISAGSGVSNG